MDRYKNTKILSCLCSVTYVPCIAHHDVLIFFCKQTKQISATSCFVLGAIYNAEYPGNHSKQEFCPHNVCRSFKNYNSPS